MKRWTHRQLGAPNFQIINQVIDQMNPEISNPPSLFQWPTTSKMPLSNDFVQLIVLSQVFAPTKIMAFNSLIQRLLWNEPNYYYLFKVSCENRTTFSVSKRNARAICNLLTAFSVKKSKPFEIPEENRYFNNSNGAIRSFRQYFMWKRWI